MKFIKHHTNATYIIMLALAMLLLSACSSLTSSKKSISLDDNLTYTLQTIPPALINTGGQSHLSLTYQDTHYQLIIQTEISAHAITMVGMSIEGLTLFSLNWHNGDQSTTISKNVPFDVEPLRILADYQLVHWPVSAVENGLQGGTITTNGSNNRFIQRAEDAIYSIETIGNKVTITHHNTDYLLVVEQLEQWKLTP